jgi:hypothetical protein
MARPGGPRLGLRDIVQDAYFNTNWHFHHSDPVVATPTAEMTGRTPAGHMLRQALPRWAGGYSPKYRSGLDEYYQADPQNSFNALRLGRYPAIDNAPAGTYLSQAEAGPAGRRARMAAQVLGGTMADVTTQGVQNVYWFLNAWEPLSMVAGRMGQHGVLGSLDGAPKGRAFSGALGNTASVFPLILGASAATGTLFRQPGYQAVLPDREGDRRETTNPLEERVMRTIGRRGALLPYDEFVKDRPDVSREQYQAYRAYLHGNKSILKGTTEGIHGPEVNFLGRSMPLLTGVLPIAGGVLGGRIGLRMAGESAAREGLFAASKPIATSWTKAREAAQEARGSGASVAANQRFKEATQKMRHHDYRIQSRLLGGSIAGSAIGLSITAAGSQLLERMRRSANARANQQQAQAEEPLAPAA